MVGAYLRALPNPKPAPPSYLPFCPDALLVDAISGHAVRRSEARFDLDGVDVSNDEENVRCAVDDDRCSSEDDTRGKDEDEDEDSADEEKDDAPRAVAIAKSSEDASREAENEKMAALRQRLAHEDVDARARATLAQKVYCFSFLATPSLS